MGGGLLQLVAYGAQDLYLTGNPQITFFKVVYRRHTNFAIESRKLIFNGSPDFGDTNTCNILKGPDLLHKLYLEIEINSGKLTCSSADNFKAFRWLNWLGHILIKRASFNIGGTEIDRHDGEWLHIWNELTQKGEKAEAYAEMVGNVPSLTQIHTTNKSDGTTYNIFDGTENDHTFKLYIPMRFWFTKSPGLALPLIALNHSDINIEVEFERLKNVIWGTSETQDSFRAATGTEIFSINPKFNSAYFYADYVYLDTDERKRFAQSAHEYLIEKVQIGSVQSSSGSSTMTYNLNFTHPVKELIWVIRQDDYIKDAYTQPRAGKQYYNYSTQFDYTGFSGTPEPSSGVGMIGGRKPQNLWNGLANVSLPHITGLFEPNLSETNSDSASTSWLSGASSKLKATATDAEKKTLGYDRVKYYHANKETNGSVETYKNKNVDRFLGVNNVQNDQYTFTLDDTSQVLASQYYGNWLSSGNNTRLLDQGKNPVKEAKLILNSNDRISPRDGFYFNVIQPMDHHTNVPAVGINSYSFAFEPEDHQPSGSCNFSRIDNASIEVTLDEHITDNNVAVQMKTYAVSYNILRIMSGLGQVAYAN